MSNQKGLTLIEAMITVTLLALLVAFAIPSFESSIARSKVRKTTELISKMISMAQSEALRRNIKVYVTLVEDAICIGLSPAQCDIGREALISNISVTGPSLVLYPFYSGLTPATFTISYSGVTHTTRILLKPVPINPNHSY